MIFRKSSLPSRPMGSISPFSSPSLSTQSSGVGMFFSAAEVGGAGGPLMLGLIHASSGGFAAGMNFLTGVTLMLLLGTFWLRSVVATTTKE